MWKLILGVLIVLALVYHYYILPRRVAAQAASAQAAPVVVEAPISAPNPAAPQSFTISRIKDGFSLKLPHFGGSQNAGH